MLQSSAAALDQLISQVPRHLIVNLIKRRGTWRHLKSSVATLRCKRIKRRGAWLLKESSAVALDCKNNQTARRLIADLVKRRGTWRHLESSVTTLDGT